MQPKDWTIRVHDILQAIDKIQRYTANMSELQFSADEKTVDAVVRNFAIIGEAANQIPEAVQKANPNLPWSEMIGMRHIVVHGYHKVSISTVWSTLKDDLPGVVPLIRSLLPK